MNAELEFLPQPGGEMKLRFTLRGNPIEGTRVRSDPFDPKDLPQFAGVYWSEELETKYTFLIKDGKLFADHAHHGEIALAPVAKDQFSTRSWFMSEVKFTRDANGKVNGMIAGGGRVTEIRFVRR